MPKLSTDEFLVACRKRNEVDETKVRNGTNVEIERDTAHVRVELEFEDESQLGEAFLQAAADRALLLRVLDKGTIDG